jgi:HK97 family phage prohead protease
MAALFLRKTLSLTEVHLKTHGDIGTFSGYASVFNGVDSYKDTILPGAFLDTLNKGMPKMFFNHEWGMPIGKYTSAKEDSIGLYLSGELTPGLSLAADVRAAMKHETLDGLSIGGYLQKGDFKVTEDGGRLIHKWSNLAEVSPVVFPADSAARIDLASVKSIDFEALLPECKTERDLERLLRDAGLPKWEAMAIVTRAREIMGGRDAPPDPQAKAYAALAERIQKITATS